MKMDRRPSGKTKRENNKEGQKNQSKSDKKKQKKGHPADRKTIKCGFRPKIVAFRKDENKNAAVVVKKAWNEMKNHPTEPAPFKPSKTQ